MSIVMMFCYNGALGIRHHPLLNLPNPSIPWHLDLHLEDHKQMHTVIILCNHSSLTRDQLSILDSSVIELFTRVWVTNASVTGLPLKDIMTDVEGRDGFYVIANVSDSIYNVITHHYPKTSCYVLGSKRYPVDTVRNVRAMLIKILRDNGYRETC